MKRYLIFFFSLLYSITSGAAALVGDQSAAKDAQLLSPSDTIDVKDFESEYIEDFELADTPPSPQNKFDISGFQEDEYSRGRMAFLFGQYEMAYKIWKPLADHGYAKAQATLGWMYHTGKGVEKDLSMAFEWYEKAAKQNHPVAQNNLGVFYEQGLSVGRSATNAAKWYREAAEWGYPFAQYNLGTLYLEGRGVKKDEKEAQFWLQIAALQGVEQAIQVLQKMSVAIHGPISGDSATSMATKGPQWTKNDTTSTKTKSPHNSPHGSSRYKDIYNRIKSTGQSDLQGFEYGSRSNVSTTSPAGKTIEKSIAKTQTSSTRSKPANSQLAENKSGTQKNSKSSATPDSTTSNKYTKADSEKQKNTTLKKHAKPSTANINEPPKPASDELLPGEKFEQWLAEAQVAQKRLKALEKEKRTNSHTLKIYNDEWVKEQNPANYTLQLARSDKLDWLLEIAKKQPMLKDTAYYTSLIDGKKWYYLIYGNFENQKSASAEIDKLPKALKKWSPWVRKFSDVQSKIQAE
ncbi:SPOR domain-containing protein [Kaarinaea lacus]